MSGPLNLVGFWWARQEGLACCILRVASGPDLPVWPSGTDSKLDLCPIIRSKTGLGREVDCRDASGECRKARRRNFGAQVLVP